MRRHREHPFEKYGLIRTMIFLLEHPEGVQRVDYRTELSLSSTSAMAVHETLYNLGLLQNIPHPTKLLFGLTEKGLKVARLLTLAQAYLDDTIRSPPLHLIIDDVIVQLQAEKENK